MKKLVFRRDAPKAFDDAWRHFISSSHVSFRYLPEYLDYMLAYAPELLADFSFVYLRDSRPVAVAFVPIEKAMAAAGGRTISLHGGFNLAPLGEDARAEAQAFEIVNQIAREQRVGKILMYLDPLLSCEATKFNPLRRYGYIDASSTDVLLDLTRSVEERTRALAEEHRRNLRKIERDPRFTFVLVDWRNPEEETHGAYRLLHRKCAGRETRPKSTFDKQFELLKIDKAMLIGLRREQSFIGFIYFLHHGDTAVYMSGADEPEESGTPIYHPILWEAARLYALRGIRWLEFSWPAGFAPVSGFLDYLDGKQLGISRFKRHFGGQIVPLWRGVRYYDREMLEADFDEFRRQAVNAIEPPEGSAKLSTVEREQLVFGP